MDNSILSVRVLQAKLIRDTDLFSKMDPYVILRIGEYVIKTSTKKSAGKYPIWNELYTFFVKTNESLKFEVWDEDWDSPDDLVGTGSFVVDGMRNSEK